MSAQSQQRITNEQLGQRLLSDKPFSVDDLLTIMMALRAPETGCPWDVEQTFQTIAPYTIEEAYEVADAIERGALDELKGELGDLLFQVVYHAQMAKEEGRFEFDDVVDAICRKMVRRHPHVFGDEVVRAATDVKGLWERVKAAERQDQGGEPRQGILDDVPLPLPSLTRAVKLQNKAAKVGFDWPSLSPVIDKLDEEILEFKEVACASEPDKEKVQEELGDILFVFANIARHLDIDPEQALRGANEKMVRRFGFIEKALAEAGKSPEESDLAEMDALWDEAKRLEKTPRS